MTQRVRAEGMTLKKGQVVYHEGAKGEVLVVGDYSVKVMFPNTPSKRAGWFKPDDLFVDIPTPSPSPKHGEGEQEEDVPELFSPEEIATAEKILGLTAVDGASISPSPTPPQSIVMDVPVNQATTIDSLRMEVTLLHKQLDKLCAEKSELVRVNKLQSEWLKNAAIEIPPLPPTPSPTRGEGEKPGELEKRLVKLEELVEAHEDYIDNQIHAAMDDAELEVERLVAAPDNPPKVEIKTLVNVARDGYFNDVVIPDGYELVSIETQVYASPSAVGPTFYRFVHVRKVGATPDVELEATTAVENDNYWSSTSPEETPANDTPIPQPLPQSIREGEHVSEFVQMLRRDDVDVEDVIAYGNQKVMRAARTSADLHRKDYQPVTVPMLESGL